MSARALGLITTLTLLLSLASPGLDRAHAQAAALAGARADLASYDLTGSRTLDTLRTLAPTAAGGGHDALEARYLRAMAATDLHLAARALGDDALDTRLAAAMGVPREGLAAELRAELEGARSGLYRGAVADELAMLSRAEGGATGLGATTQPRQAAWALLAVAAECRAGALTGPNPTAELRAAIAAHGVASRGVREGDPLLAAIGSALAAARDTVLAYAVRVPPALGGEATLAAADADAPSGAVPDVLVVVDASRVLVACGARVRVTGTGELATELPSAACPELGHARAIALPASLPTVPQPVDALVAAFTALALPSTASIAIAMTETAPMHVGTRTLRSLARANLTPSLVALGAGAGLETSPLAIATAEEAPSITVHVRLGGYAVARARGHDATVPRVRGEHGLQYDRTGLAAALAQDAFTAASIDGMGPVPMVEVVRAMRALASSGARVTLALP